MKKLLIIITLMVLGTTIFWLNTTKGSSTPEKAPTIVQPHYGVISQATTTTGTIEPRSRLEVKPPISGRLEQLLVSEGSYVKKGQIIAWMSSSERAALLDAAGTKDKNTQEYWASVYKATPLIAPMNGQVIVCKMKPGQIISAADAVVVISDQLIITAQVDETDIGKVKNGQRATITLDAYQETLIPGSIEHISYESTLVNNVTTYEVTIALNAHPSFLRSGMSASIAIITAAKNNALLIPNDAIQEKDSQLFVTLQQGSETKQVKIHAGIRDDQNCEVITGLTKESNIIIGATNSLKRSKKSAAASPFLPQRPRNH